MTQVYLVRHAQSDNSVHASRERPLSDIGRRDAKAVTWTLKDRNITVIASSPYKRSCDTVKDLADTLGLAIVAYEDLRERTSGKWFEGDFFDFAKKQWSDFDYSIENGESLGEAQERNIRALKKLLKEHGGENIVIGTHGTALSTILNYFYPQFGFEEFKKIVNFTPFVIRLDFEGETLLGAQVELVMHKHYKE